MLSAHGYDVKAAPQELFIRKYFFDKPHVDNRSLFECFLYVGYRFLPYEHVLPTSTPCDVFVVENKKLDHPAAWKGHNQNLNWAGGRVTRHPRQRPRAQPKKYVYCFHVLSPVIEFFQYGFCFFSLNFCNNRS